MFNNVAIKRIVIVSKGKKNLWRGIPKVTSVGVSFFSHLRFISDSGPQLTLNWFQIKGKEVYAQSITMVRKV